MSLMTKGVLVVAVLTVIAFSLDYVYPQAIGSLPLITAMIAVMCVGFGMMIIDAYRKGKKCPSVERLNGTLLVCSAFAVATYNSLAPLLARIGAAHPTFRMPNWVALACFIPFALGIIMLMNAVRRKCTNVDSLSADHLKPGDYTVACAYVSIFGALYIVTMQGGPRLICACHWNLDNSECKPNELRAGEATSAIDYITIERRRGINGNVAIVTPHRYPPDSPLRNLAETKPESG